MSFPSAPAEKKTKNPKTSFGYGSRYREPRLFVPLYLPCQGHLKTDGLLFCSQREAEVSLLLLSAGANLFEC